MSTATAEGTTVSPPASPPPAPPAPVAATPPAVVPAPIVPSAPAQTATAVSKEDITRHFDDLMANRAKNDPIKLARMLIKGNLELQTKLRTAETGALAAEDRARKALPDGHVTLPKTDADQLAAYRALGTVDEVKATITRYGELNTTVTTATREKLTAGAAQYAEWDEKVVADLARKDGLEFVEATETGKDGAQEKVYHVKGPLGDKGGVKEITLQELINGPWRIYRDALLPASEVQAGARPRPDVPSFGARPPVFQTPAALARHEPPPKGPTARPGVTQVAPFLGKGGTPMRTHDAWAGGAGSPEPSSVFEANRRAASAVSGGI